MACSATWEACAIAPEDVLSTAWPLGWRWNDQKFSLAQKIWKLHTYFFPNLATIIEPLVALTRKKIVKRKTLFTFWGPEQAWVIVEFKELSTYAPISGFRALNVVRCLRGRRRLRCWSLLAQKWDDGDMAYFSRRLSSGQKHYSATQKERYVVVQATIIYIFRWLHFALPFDISTWCKTLLTCYPGGSSHYNLSSLNIDPVD